MTIKERWNERYRAAEDSPRAARVLRENLHLLPDRGHALDLACGRGGNALLLAQRGLRVTAWDIADIAIESLRDAASGSRLSLQAAVRDVELQPPGPGTFDVIVVAYFLAREIIPALIQALRPGGLIFYQTFTRNRLSGRGPRRAEFRLAEQELLQLFSPLQVVFYREDGVAGNTGKGLGDEAMYIGRKTGCKKSCHAGR